MWQESHFVMRGVKHVLFFLVLLRALSNLLGYWNHMSDLISGSPARTFSIVARRELPSRLWEWNNANFYAWFIFVFWLFGQLRRISYGYAILKYSIFIIWFRLPRAFPINHMFNQFLIIDPQFGYAFCLKGNKWGYFWIFCWSSMTRESKSSQKRTCWTKWLQWW